VTDATLHRREKLGGWLQLLSRLLLFWHPVILAFALSSAMAALGIRGMPLAILLIARIIVTGIGVAAGMAIVRRLPGAATFAQVALALSASMDLFVYLTPIFPHNRMPGDTPFYVAASLSYHAAWILYLRRSRRVRETL
jgi:hypothetical protein